MCYWDSLFAEPVTYDCFRFLIGEKYILYALFVVVKGVHSA